MVSTNKYNYYIALINICDTLDDADRLIMAHFTHNQNVLQKAIKTQF